MEDMQAVYDEEVNGELFENHGCSEIEENCTMYGRDVWNKNKATWMLNGRVRKEEEEANKSLDYDDLVMNIIVYRHLVSYII